MVLVHGAFVDGAGWEGVYQSLKRDGHDVSVVQNSTVSLEDDVAVTKLAIAAQKHDVILVGHSYGGAVITEAGNDPKVAGLVYVAGWIPDAGESISTLLHRRDDSRIFVDAVTRVETVRIRTCDRADRPP